MDNQRRARASSSNQPGRPHPYQQDQRGTPGDDPRLSVWGRGQQHRTSSSEQVQQRATAPGADPRHSAPGQSRRTNPPEQRSTERAAQAPPQPLIVAGSSRMSVQEYRSRQQGPVEGSIGSGVGSDASSSLRLIPIRERPITNPELLRTRPSHIESKLGDNPHAKVVNLEVNYFKLLKSTDWRLYKYRVDFAPEEERNFVRKGMLRSHKNILGGYIFDGTLLYASHRLPQVVSIRKSDEAPIQITIRFVGDMERGDEHYLQLYNIIMRKCLEFLKLQLVGRDFYDAANRVEVKSYKLELWPGYETSIRQREHDILMCSEIRHKVMRQQTIHDILAECYNSHGASYQARFSAKVIGLTVLTDYNNHTYRIDDVDYTATPLSTFTRRTDEVTYKDYYRNKYSINIRDMQQPMLLSRSNARERRAGLAELVYLVPELCRATGLTDEMRNDHRMMRELANHTRINPNGRIQRLLNFNRRLQSEAQVVNELNEWNLKLDNKLATVAGRILASEEIAFGGSAKNIRAGDQADWTQKIRDKQMFRTAILQDWFVIFPKRLANETQTFVGTMRESVRNMNFSIANPERCVIDDDRASSYVSAIENIMSRKNPQLIMCIVPNNRADRYSAIKKKSCIDRPVATQCILGKNLIGNRVPSIATKVAVQINCKLGGTPWTVRIPSPKMMIVGYDVCRDTTTTGRHYGAVVAVLDQYCTTYFSAVRAHTSVEEMSDNLATMVCTAIQKFRKINGEALPDRIIIYRDGVSDGEIPYVFEQEVEHLKDKLASCYGASNAVRLSYILVSKRINTRLFLNRDNPPPGTVVDDVITDPLKYDFFIVSHHVRQGTVTPTSYNVMYDSSGLNPARIQSLTYKLTHMYFNWSGTIRVPAPCQLARKLASLVSQSIHATPSDQLQGILYYL